MRCHIPPSQEAVEAVERNALMQRGTIQDANVFWAAYRRRVALAIADGVLPPDIVEFEKYLIAAASARTP